MVTDWLAEADRISFAFLIHPATLPDSVEFAAAEERDLLAALSSPEREQLNKLLAKLLAGLQSELGPAPKHGLSA